MTTVIDHANPWFAPRKTFARTISHQLSASAMSGATGSARSQPKTSSRFLPIRSESAPALRLASAFATPKPTTNASTAASELRWKSRFPMRGKTLRSSPTIAPTRALTPTSRLNCAAFARSPRRTVVTRALVRFRLPLRVKIGPPYVADEEGVASEHEPGLGVPAPPVCDDIGVVSRSVPGRRERAHEGVPECDLGPVPELLVLELDAGLRREVRGRARRLDERGQAGHVVSLHVRLEHGRDRRVCALRFPEIRVDERFVRIDDRELALGQAAEQIRRARRLLIQEGAQDHSLRLWRLRRSR